ncbi:MULTISPECIES: 3-hydroxyacyl-CoA dehydrogenase [Paraburkholderia]|uniref:3-hydroxyacyl-CoA dehydrogenase n=1 Tax=Paraburkholderia metrosideri TaxID=580937 RepID=A0ABW9E3N4_9BURK
MRIKNRICLVTGAGSGLGAATVRRLVAHGARVVATDVNETTGAALARELGESVRFVAADVADPVSAQRAVDLAVHGFGALHVLVNCAGIAPAEKVLGRAGPHDLDAFERTLMVNLLGTFNMIRLSAAAMTATSTEADNDERGVIVNTASIAAFDGQIGQAAYAASKGGVVAMTLPIARELARHGIRVMTIAPGIMETPMLLDMPAEVQASLGNMVPFPPRLGKPDEYAALVQHIVENPYLNGEVIRLDGAIRMSSK